MIPNTVATKTAYEAPTASLVLLTPADIITTSRTEGDYFQQAENQNSF